MLDHATAEALTRSLMLGTARRPLPAGAGLGGLLAADDPKAVLKAAALLGQRGRFARPRLSQVPVSEPILADPRSLPPDAARPLFLSLLAGKSGHSADPVALAIADAMARRRLKLHPFDLPRLEAFVRAHAAKLGASAMAWAGRHAGAEESGRGAFDAEAIDETNWQQAGPARKSAFIRSLRGTAPDRARDLVAGIFATEPAATRVALLQGLAAGLSEADRPFLDSLSGDRALTVRETAEALLARLPGSARSRQRLQEAIDRLHLGHTGLLKRRATLRLEFPATIKEWQRESWAVATIATAGLDDLAGGLRLTVDTMAVAAEGDEILAVALAVRAAREERFDLLARLARAGAARAWIASIEAGDLNEAEPAFVARWSAAALHPELWTDLPAGALARLHEAIRAPLPETAIRTILAAPAWRSLTAAAQRQEAPLAEQAFTALVALTPAPLRHALQTELAPLPPTLTARALTAIALLDHIDAA
ncbi:hypothetical protein QFZ27_002570 [Inquilinus ginsengisoli]|uniref:DUF5691 domain-containing protein n=1 Tax=Inquilinus ginsengisoli TaxID=363840 RepID=UPI003D230F2E